MFGQLFGKYLVEKGVMSYEDYRDAVQKQLSARAKLGTIAVAEGMLTQEQAEIPQKSRVFQKLIFAPIDTDGIAFTAGYGNDPTGRVLCTQQLDFSNKTGSI